MADKKNEGSIDLRLALPFHRAPDVHTLLYMTPKSKRSEVIIEALRLYIERTGHPAGKQSVQLKAVEAWITGERAQPAANSLTDSPGSTPVVIPPSAEKLAEPVATSMQAALVTESGSTSVSHPEAPTDLDAGPTSSGALGRWAAEFNEEP